MSQEAELANELITLRIATHRHPERVGALYAALSDWYDDEPPVFACWELADFLAKTLTPAVWR